MKTTIKILQLIKSFLYGALGGIVVLDLAGIALDEIVHTSPPILIGAIILLLIALIFALTFVLWQLFLAICDRWGGAA